jgi:hypothetical protein
MRPKRQSSRNSCCSQGHAKTDIYTYRSETFWEPNFEGKLKKVYRESDFFYVRFTASEKTRENLCHTISLIENQQRYFNRR